MSFPITLQSKVPPFESRPIRGLWATIILTLFTSCGSDDLPKSERIPVLWEGNQTDFDRGFSFRSEGNESVLHYDNSGLPYSGAIERNSSEVSTRQAFTSGKLNGLSSKRSADGSRVDANYRGGLLHGEMTFYSADGTIRSVMNFEEGRLVAAPVGEGRGEANASSF